MNRIVIIGNGFDLAHGLKTSYQDFITSLEQRLISKMINDLFFYSKYFDINLTEVQKVSINFKNINSLSQIRKKINDFNNRIIIYKNQLFKAISDNSNFNNWVDIECEFYKLLKHVTGKLNLTSVISGYDANILNTDLKMITNDLEIYLTEAIKNNDCFLPEIITHIYSEIDNKDLQILPVNRDLEKVMILSFNYTNIEAPYSNSKIITDVIHIHGELNNPRNPIIFGYGDEMDKYFQDIENLNNNAFLENIKTIKYSETNNYNKVLEFINLNQYQIIILGHSCGLSDRTLLNKLFEHNNCISIKPYYHKTSSNNDNYRDIVKNIYRNFTDKGLMREKVVNKEYCSPMI